MAKEKFLLVNLKEDKAKKLAQVLSNESCRKILDYLTEKEGTESTIAKDLELPISTVHYNLEHLMKSGLVTVEEYHYSQKGREVNHYKLANKYIIIAPKSTFGLKEKLRSILPVALLAVIGAGIIQLFIGFRQTFGSAVKAAAPEMMQDTAIGVGNRIVEEATPKATEAVMNAGPEMADAAANMMANETVIQTITHAPPLAVSQPNYALWFLLGCIFTLILFIIIQYIIYIQNKNKN
jgi:DNA-binding transcriptional ArsR family regulator